MTQQGDRQESVRGVTGTTGTYNEDFLSLFALAGISPSTWNGDALQYFRAASGGTTIDEALNAFARANGAYNWASLGAVPWPVVVDRFTDPDSTLITAHTPDLAAASWVLTTTDATTPPANSVVITDNAMNINFNARGAVINSSRANVQVSTRALYRTGSRFGVVVRHDSNGSMVVCRVRGPEAVSELISINNNVITTIGASVAIALVDNTPYDFRAVADGTTVTFFQDGTELFSRTGVTAFQTATQQGMVAFGGTLTNRYDDFVVSAL